VPISKIKKILIISWMTALCFMLLANAHAWEIPAYLRLQAGARVWFSFLEGDLIQPDRTKLGILDNLGLKQDSIAWEYLFNIRMANIHLLRLRVEPSTLYDQSVNESFIKLRAGRVGYDLDFFMTPRLLLGGNVDLDVLNLQSSINQVIVGNFLFDYFENQTRAIPSVGLHWTYYPTFSGILLRPNFSTRMNWWDYESLETRDLEVSTAVDIPISELWTWTLSGGYRIWNIKLKRERDRIDMTRKGFFIETSILF
jgi:hypothetical protein